MTDQTFANLNGLAAHLRGELNSKKFILLYAYNGTGKTRLSMAFKDIGKQGDARDTLYFNAFTEDLFYWDNDLNNDRERVLKINKDSRFFAGLDQLEMDTRIRPLLSRYADFDFRIDTTEWEVSFSREITTGEGEQAKTVTVDDIKVSRGEENIFIWCFFLAIVQLVLDGAQAYSWVKYLYIDDPISSLDDNNAIAVASDLAQLLKAKESPIRAVISSHHALFFNVMHNELDARKSKKTASYFLSQPRNATGYRLRYTNATPFFHHVAMLTELYQAAKSGRLYTYHFNMLRSLLEKSASFHGFPNFSACIKQDDDDPDGILHARLINILSHGNYSLYEPQEMLEENKAYFKKILNDFLGRYPFNPELFPDVPEEAAP
ncbi:AAA family ATPase [Methylococcus capsulatus]|jgi:wobble nucleotide-excising tRNase|uniref:AAA_13 domain-containing protein n=1 Tax=Methylococcus capsulatus TaxID=414 RepID=A0AA35V2Z3_METCP|nr:AAA family ATPase [Methylococcus capsulatus]CAI8775962.1 AAA_13 domain-containing protein [Methylococcus capsulatus]